MNSLPDRLQRIMCGMAACIAGLALLGGCATAELPVGPVSMPQAQVISAPAPVASAASAASAAEASVSSAEAVAVLAPEEAASAVDPLRPDVRVDLDDRSAQTNLWDRVRRGFRMPDLDTRLVKSAERWYATRPDYVQRMTERGSRYLFHIIEEVEKRGMPSELALLPFIESAFNPQAMSSARASGMWQFIPATGRDYDLRQNVFRDDRRDVLASTRAALDYLQRLHDLFGDWHLALAAYNWGEGNVRKAIAYNQRRGRPTDYLSLRMPNETKYYVPKLQAVKNIVANPEPYSLTLPTLSNHPYFLSVPIMRDIDVALAAKFAGLALDDFQTLNPQMNKPVILAAGTPQVLLPYDNANQFVRQIAAHRGPMASWTAWVAPRNVRPAEAARAVGMTEEDLREVNQIPPRMLVRAGSTLLVTRGEQASEDVSNELADNATIALAPDGPVLRRNTLRAGRHDTVTSIAHRYRVSPALVAQWNGVSTNTAFRPGQTVTVYVAGKATRAGKTVKAKSSAKKPAAKRRARSSKSSR